MWPVLMLPHCGRFNLWRNLTTTPKGFGLKLSEGDVNIIRKVTEETRLPILQYTEYLNSYKHCLFFLNNFIISSVTIRATIVAAPFENLPKRCYGAAAL